MKGVFIFPDQSAAAAGGAERFVALAERAVAERGRFAVALSGGGTPAALYARLASAPWSQRIPWGQVYVFWGDERCVPPGDPGSNYGAARQILLDQVPIPVGNIHRVKGEWPPPRASEAYAADLAHFFGAGWPRFDLILLGLGGDGHTASLFPGAAALDVRDRVAVTVTADYEGRPAERVTLTLPVINQARQVCFLVTGAAKAEIVRAVLRGAPTGLPAQRVRPAAGELEWWLDAAAATRLDLADWTDRPGM